MVSGWVESTQSMRVTVNDEVNNGRRSRLEYLNESTHSMRIRMMLIMVMVNNTSTINISKVVEVDNDRIDEVDEGYL